MDLLSIFTVLEYQIITLISDAIGMGVESAIGMGVESAFSISLVLITRNIVIRRVLQVRTCTRSSTFLCLCLNNFGSCIKILFKILACSHCRQVVYTALLSNDKFKNCEAHVVQICSNKFNKYVENIVHQL